MKSFSSNFLFLFFFPHGYLTFETKQDEKNIHPTNVVDTYQ